MESLEEVKELVKQYARESIEHAENILKSLDNKVPLSTFSMYCQGKDIVICGEKVIYHLLKFELYEQKHEHGTGNREVDA